MRYTRCWFPAEDPRLERGGSGTAELCGLEVDPERVEEVDNYWKQKDIESHFKDGGKVIIEDDDGYCD